ncbi:MAG: hypothetical protein JKY48_09590, partial [Flavobacteriales bacterium]|nr:hypothetical protein [Flavobacteriales bacterium]
MKIKNKIDFLNIILIPICGVLAYFFPLKVFILSFCILGPLHYLTEINWLNENRYFSALGKKKWLIVGLITSFILIVPRLYFELIVEDESSSLTQLITNINYWSNGAIFSCLLLAIASPFIKKKRDWLIIALIAIASSYFLNEYESFTIIIGVLVPTILHVYVFTLLFMLYGAKKNKSKTGYVSIVLAIIVPALFIIIPIDPSNFLFDDYFKSALVDNHLHTTPVLFSKFLGLSDGTSFFFYEDLELRLMMFISFIYLYHYLNWFSKTTTIYWHKNLTKKR